VDKIKQDMLAGTYDWDGSRGLLDPVTGELLDGRIGGYLGDDGTYYVGEGHHRMNAALEIFEETGDSSYVDQLLENGAWTPGEPPANDIGPLPRK
jgi:filamentous hemagglutinin